MSGDIIFQRCPHDTDHPYSIVSNALTRDISTSPEVRWLVTYLLSNRDGWVIKVSQIIAHLKGHWGRNKVYRIIKDAIEAGYIYREIYTAGNLTRARYLVSETPKFKKCYRLPQNGDAQSGHAQNGHTKEVPIEPIGSKEDQVEESSCPKPKGSDVPPVSFSPEVKRLTKRLADEVRTFNSKAKIPKDLSAWEDQVDKMIRLDGHTPEEIESIIRLTFQDNFWGKNILSASKLREKFPQLWAQFVPRLSGQGTQARQAEELRESNKNKARAVESASVSITAIIECFQTHVRIYSKKPRSLLKSVDYENTNFEKELSKALKEYGFTNVV